MSGMNQTPSGERVHIAFFGRRNVGKSSLANAFTGQSLAIVSDVRGTTTDPVSKSMELLPLGPVVVTDTPGIDDEGGLGALRVRKTHEVLGRTDLAIVVADASAGLAGDEQALLAAIKEKGIPYILAWNKCDLLDAVPEATAEALWVSARDGVNIGALRERAAHMAAGRENKRALIADLLRPGDGLVLVIPIDASAPKGRLILPQQQVLRDALEAGAVPVACRPEELPGALAMLSVPPRLVVTDSQAFAAVSRMVPENIRLTSFSILMARYKGSLPVAVAGAAAVGALRSGDRVLIAEGCTHHRQCEDIGTVKLPRWIRQYTGVEPAFCFTSGTEFPQDLSGVRLVVHCGGCMLNEREMGRRLDIAKAQGVPMTNYGILIAFLNGILKRALEPFPDLYELLSR